MENNRTASGSYYSEYSEKCDEIAELHKKFEHCIPLPCKIGDPVFLISTLEKMISYEDSESMIFDCELDSIEIHRDFDQITLIWHGKKITDKSFSIHNFDNILFTDRTAAENKLAELSKL